MYDKMFNGCKGHPVHEKGVALVLHDGNVEMCSLILEDRHVYMMKQESEI